MDAVSLLYLEVFDFPYTLLIQVKYSFLSWEIMRNLGSKEGKKKMGREEWNCPKLTQSFSKLATIFFLANPISEPDGRHFLASIFSISGICHVPNEYLIR